MNTCATGKAVFIAAFNASRSCLGMPRTRCKQAPCVIYAQNLINIGQLLGLVEFKPLFLESNKRSLDTPKATIKNKEVVSNAGT